MDVDAKDSVDLRVEVLPERSAPEDRHAPDATESYVEQRDDIGADEEDGIWPGGLCGYEWFTNHISWMYRDQAVAEAEAKDFGRLDASPEERAKYENLQLTLRRIERPKKDK